METNDYRAVAKQLGVKYLFGRWGFQLLPKDPWGRVHKLIQIVPLDGWITDPKEVERIMRERGLEL